VKEIAEGGDLLDLWQHRSGRRKDKEEKERLIRCGPCIGCGYNEAIAGATVGAKTRACGRMEAKPRPTDGIGGAGRSSSQDATLTI